MHTAKRPVSWVAPGVAGAAATALPEAAAVVVRALAVSAARLARAAREAPSGAAAALAAAAIADLGRLTGGRAGARVDSALGRRVGRHRGLLDARVDAPGREPPRVEVERRGAAREGEAQRHASGPSAITERAARRRDGSVGHALARPTKFSRGTRWPDAVGHLGLHRQGGREAQPRDAVTFASRAAAKTPAGALRRE